MDNQSSKYELKFAFNVPNTITAIRVVMAVVIAWLLLQGEFFAGGIVLVVAALTDWMDGFIARRLGQASLVGSLFDVVADELLFMPSLIIAVVAGLFSRVDGMMPLNPYLYAVPALAGGVVGQGSPSVRQDDRRTTWT